MTEPGSASTRAIYIERVNAVIDHIESHLDEDLTLERLADVAHFSPYHFHRVFSTMVGEPLHSFIGRLRVERAATLLISDPDRPVTSIATACGYGTPSSFGRAFKETYGMSATEWRSGGYVSYLDRHPASGDQARADLGTVEPGFGVRTIDRDPHTGAPAWTIGAGSLGDARVAVEMQPDLRVAYVRHTGPYQGMGDVFSDLFTRLMAWAGPRDLVVPGAWLLAIYHDNPSITDDDRLRVSVALSIPEEAETGGPVGEMVLPGGRIATGRFLLGEQDYGVAWHAMSAGWLPESGYEPDDRLPFERYPITEGPDVDGRVAVDVCLPVRPLQR